MPLHIDAPARRHLVSTYPNTRRCEVPRVRVRLEADKVRAEHAVQDLLPARQAPEYLRTREGRMHKEADGGVGDCLPQECRDEEKMVVVNPDEVSGPVNLGDTTSECGVDCRVRCPVCVRGRVFGGDILPQQIVEERPERCEQKLSVSVPSVRSEWDTGDFVRHASAAQIVQRRCTNTRCALGNCTVSFNQLRPIQRSLRGFEVREPPGTGPTIQRQRPRAMQAHAQIQEAPGPRYQSGGECPLSGSNGRI